MTDTLDGPSGFHRMTRRDAIRDGFSEPTDDERAQLAAEAAERVAAYRAAELAMRQEPAPDLTLDAVLEEINWSRAYAAHRVHPACGCDEDSYGDTDLCEWARELGFEHAYDEDPTPRPAPEPEPVERPSRSPLEGMTIISDCRMDPNTVLIGAFGMGSYYTGSVYDGRKCTTDEPCDVHRLADERDQPLNPDDFPDLGSFLNAELLRSLDRETDKVMWTEVLHGDGTGEMKGILNDPDSGDVVEGFANAATQQRALLHDMSWRLPLVLNARDYDDMAVETKGVMHGVAKTSVVGVVDEWSLRPSDVGAVMAAAAFDVPARFLTARNGPAYDTAAIVAAQDLEWKDRT